MRITQLCIGQIKAGDRRKASDCHSCEGRNPFAMQLWIPAFAGMTTSRLCGFIHAYLPKLHGTSIAFLLSTLALFMLAPVASAHGTEIDLNEVEAVEIHARFDNGDPMADAQVAIYAPTDRATPWLTGQADENGHFVFVPDRTLAGQWDVQLRTAGHGDWVYIDIAEGSITELKGSGGGLTTAQIALMSAAIIWGFVGTALYFMGNKKEQETTADEVVLAS